jgi:hypothetical protein
MAAEDRARSRFLGVVRKGRFAAALARLRQPVLSAGFGEAGKHHLRSVPTAATSAALRPAGGAGGLARQPGADPPTPVCSFGRLRRATRSRALHLKTGRRCRHRQARATTPTDAALNARYAPRRSAAAHVRLVAPCRRGRAPRQDPGRPLHASDPPRGLPRRHLWRHPDCPVGARALPR